MARRLHVVPVLLGRGAHLFEGIPAAEFRTFRVAAWMHAVHREFERA